MPFQKRNAPVPHNWYPTYTHAGGPTTVQPVAAAHSAATIGPAIIKAAPTAVSSYAANMSTPISTARGGLLPGPAAEVVSRADAVFVVASSSWSRRVLARPRDD